MSGLSIREQILLAVLAAVRPHVQSLGATLHRSPTVAISREQCPALVVFPESEAITERANDRVTRELTVRVVALARAVDEGMGQGMADDPDFATLRTEPRFRELLARAAGRGGQ